MSKKLYADLRSGCCAIYFEDRKGDTNCCDATDKRNIAYSNKDAKYVDLHWEMDVETQKIFEDMVNSYNEREDIQSEVLRLRSIIEGLECLCGGVCGDSCQVCLAKIKAKEGV